jgi:protoheme ferro-lyase
MYIDLEVRNIQIINFNIDFGSDNFAMGYQNKRGKRKWKKKNTARFIKHLMEWL